MQDVWYTPIDLPHYALVCTRTNADDVAAECVRLPAHATRLPKDAPDGLCGRDDGDVDDGGALAVRRRAPAEDVAPVARRRGGLLEIGQLRHLVRPAGAVCAQVKHLRIARKHAADGTQASDH